MKVSINDYVRTKEGYICKILGLNDKWNDDGYLDNNDIYSPAIQEKNIVKSSSNIIDLIEVGDYVNGKEVEEIIKNNRKLEPGTMIYTNSGTTLSGYYNENIYSIITKEQFGSMGYRV